VRALGNVRPGNAANDPADRNGIHRVGARERRAWHTALVQAAYLANVVRGQLGPAVALATIEQGVRILKGNGLGVSPGFGVLAPGVVIATRENAILRDGLSVGMAALGHAIALIRSVIAKEQVSGITALRIITVMADEKISRVYACRQEVGYAMSDKIGNTLITELPIMAGSRGAPGPAFVWPASIDTRPEVSRFCLRQWRKASSRLHRFSSAMSIAHLGGTV